jgi:hypothetical protein
MKNKSTNVEPTTNAQNDANTVLAEVNYSAIGTWLEPWIGWEVEVVKTSKNLIWFKWDIGHKFITERYDKRCFNLR